MILELEEVRAYIPIRASRNAYLKGGGRTTSDKV